MITHLSPLFRNAGTQIRPEDLLLTKGSWVFFSERWAGKPATWAKGKVFEVAQEPLLVRYPASYILPGNDYRDIDLSNVTAGLKLYPEETHVVYQVGVGFKPGSYITHIFIPKDRYVYTLGESSMYPQLADSDKRYVGAFHPEDSPAEAPLLFVYLIKDGPAVHLIPWVTDDMEDTWDKVTLEFFVNKCRLTEIDASEEHRRRARRIASYEELTGY